MTVVFTLLSRAKWIGLIWGLVYLFMLSRSILINVFLLPCVSAFVQTRGRHERAYTHACVF